MCLIRFFVFLPQVVDFLVDAFTQVGMPLTVVNVVDALDRVLPGKRNALAAQLWKRAEAVICRPDLYVAWTLGPRLCEFNSETAKSVASTLCGLASSTSDPSVCNTQWLTWRMVSVLLWGRVGWVGALNEWW